MKMILTISLAFSTAMVLLAYSLYQENNLLQEEIASLSQAEERFQREIAQHAGNQVEADNQVEQLRAEVRSSSFQIAELAAELRETRALVEPDIEQLRTSIRHELEDDFVREQVEAENRRQQVSMVSELTRLSPDRLHTLMRVNSLYGDFFNSLEVSDERMEGVVDSFIEMTEMQNAALDDLSSYNPQTKEEAEALMMPILDSNLVNEVISAELTAEELELFTEYQQSHFVEGLPVRPEF